MIAEKWRQHGPHRAIASVMSMSHLSHNPELGESDPRNYPLLCCVHLGCTKVGSHERVLQLNRLGRVVDRIFEDLGEKQARMHFTAKPGVDVTHSIEVRIQCVTTPTVEQELELVQKAQEQMDIIREHGEQGGWTVVD